MSADYFAADVTSWIKDFLTDKNIPERLHNAAISNWKNLRDEYNRGHSDACTIKQLGPMLVDWARSRMTPEEMYAQKLATMTDRQLIESIFIKLECSV